MVNIFDQYGIKEVCDVTFYDSDDKPVLYLDTLKVSTMEQTAENTSARGGKGNPELIIWDYNKEITITLEDALFSAKSMAMMFGDTDLTHTITQIEKTVKADQCNWNSETPTTLESVTINDKKYTPVSEATIYYIMKDGTTTTAITIESEKADIVFVKCKLAVVKDSTQVIDINADKFPGTYKIVGDTYARNTSGVDEFFQLVIPKAKIQSEVTLTMEAEGDPSTFSMNLKVLRPDSGAMVQLIKYQLSTPTE